MVRTITKSDNNELKLQLPDDLVGKMIEVIAFSIEETKKSSKTNPSKVQKINALKKRLKKFSINSGGYKFDRNEANDYE